MSVGCFIAGMLAGGLLVFVSCALWALEAMHPHGETKGLASETIRPKRETK